METNRIDENTFATQEPEQLVPDPAPTPVDADAPAPKKRRGFAAMAPELVKAISRKGGVAAHAKGTAHEFTADEAREAGRKGGYASQARRRDKPAPKTV
jgi:general stress protein YciG